MRLMPLVLLLSLLLIPDTVKAQPVLSDSWLTLQIHSRFVPDDALENSDIDVDTNRGLVTLHGTVATQLARERAAAIAAATDGVTSVKNNLRVARASAGRMQDGWVKAKIAAQLVAESALDNSDIDIDVGRGAVTLTGTVSSDIGRARAESLVKVTDGVKSVRNNLKVSAPAH